MSKNEALFRKSTFCARGRDVRDQPLGIVWLIAERQVDDFLAIEGLPVRWKHEGIGDHKSMRVSALGERGYFPHVDATVDATTACFDHCAVG